jgi:hypothetical protein
MRALGPILAVPLAVLSVPALAMEDAERGAIQEVIRNQLEAFRADDAPGAYSYAAPSIRRMFPTSETFIDMVRRGYPPVYRPKAYAFGETKEGSFGPTQSVRITDSEGTDWLAVYTMEKQEDGSWRISGCVLVKDEAKSV